jgi:hypothetical protein
VLDQAAPGSKKRRLQDESIRGTIKAGRGKVNL